MANCSSHPTGGLVGGEHRKYSTSLKIVYLSLHQLPLTQSPRLLYKLNVSPTGHPDVCPCDVCGATNKILHYTTTPHSARTRACFRREATPFSPRSHSHRKSILFSSRVGYYFSIPPLWCFMKFICLQCKVHAS